MNFLTCLYLLWSWSLTMILSGFNTFIATLQGPWVNYFVDIANTYPYLWALYAIALVLPFVLCAACCVRTKVGAVCVCVCVCVCVRMRTYFRNMFYVFSCQAHNITPSPLLCSKHMLLDDFLNQIPTALMMFATPASFIMGHTSVDHGWICRPMFPCKHWLKKTFLFSSFM